MTPEIEREREACRALGGRVFNAFPLPTIAPLNHDTTDKGRFVFVPIECWGKARAAEWKKEAEEQGNGTLLGWRAVVLGYTSRKDQLFILCLGDELKYPKGIGFKKAAIDRIGMYAISN